MEQQHLIPVGEEENKKVIDLEKTKEYKLKLLNLKKDLLESGFSGEMVRAASELTIYWKFLTMVDDIDIDELKIKTKKTKKKGFPMTFWIENEKKYKELMETYKYKTSVLLNSRLLYNNTYAHSNPIIQETESSNDGHPDGVQQN